jgi:glutamate dehydrogenase (NADP+)
VNSQLSIHLASVDPSALLRTAYPTVGDGAEERATGPYQRVRGEVQIRDLHSTKPGAGSNPLWNHKADCAFPSAHENEISGKDAANPLEQGVYVVSEGANMPSTPDAVERFIEHRILFGPGKAANAGAVAVSGLEMAQNSMRYAWTREEVDGRLHIIMKSIDTACVEAAQHYGTPGNYVNGANIAGFLKVANSMLDQGLV